MTILKNSKTDKKPDTSVTLNNSRPNAVGSPPELTAENRNGSISKWRSIFRLLAIVAATICILLFSLAIGMACGRVYRYYLISQQDYCPRRLSFGCSTSVPFEPEKIPYLSEEPPFLKKIDSHRHTFKQDFELDIENKRYEIMTVRYKDQRSGAFVHDFKTNLTAIVDTKKGRCFLVPLDRCKVLPPNMLFGLVHKTMHGFDVSTTKVFNETLRAVLPSIANRLSLGCYISQYCSGRSIYKLVRCSKRAGLVPDTARYAEFAGTGIIQYEIVNYRLIERYEDVDLD